ncbi:MBL fold metallo-hydrolase [Oricola cellulosilytica]|uniref:MBL fold metallo-hydrolase n=1 Tax=Oricola cellulosilytica TaxID=1429082 RepID=A0A4R0PG27_9HYPH|nr:MBL fold metallo-hydrolase [Oricola cellulosilytica]TCD16601.1 MBL fold metallo-hydrolase [Oricola cellulosilytica]
MLTKTSPSRGNGSPEVTGFYDEATGSIQYVAADPQSDTCVIIDAVLDFEPANARTSTESVDEILSFVEKKGLSVAWILDTHPHADHFMASSYLREKLNAPAAIGEKARDIADLWRDLYHQQNAFDVDSHFDRLVAEGEELEFGTLGIRVMLTPGHTLGSVTYVIGDAAFVNDTFMHVDTGTARCDFPGGSARELYSSLQSLLALPDETRLFVGHDYGNDNRDEAAWEATVSEHRDGNVHIGGGVSEAEFVALREKRDATLPLPDRMLHALQVNLRGGRLPETEADGHSYLRIPLNRL